MTCPRWSSGDISRDLHCTTLLRNRYRDTAFSRLHLGPSRTSPKVESAWSHADDASNMLGKRLGLCTQFDSASPRPARRLDRRGGQVELQHSRAPLGSGDNDGCDEEDAAPASAERAAQEVLSACGRATAGSLDDVAGLHGIKQLLREARASPVLKLVLAGILDLHLRDRVEASLSTALCRMLMRTVSGREVSSTSAHVRDALQAVLLPLRFPTLFTGLRSGARAVLLHGAPGELQPGAPWTLLPDRQ